MNNEQHQDFATQREYSGYTGASEQSSQMFEQQSQRQQQETAYRPEYQSTYMNGQTPYGYPPLFSSAQPLEGARLGAALSYGLGWFSGILFFLFAGENRYIRFHALQSIAFFGAINLLDVILFVILAERAFHSPWLFLLSFLFLGLVNVIGFVGWLVAIIQAGRGVYYKLPFVGEAVARRMNWNTIK